MFILRRICASPLPSLWLSSTVRKLVAASRSLGNRFPVNNLSHWASTHQGVCIKPAVNVRQWAFPAVNSNLQELDLIWPAEKNIFPEADSNVLLFSSTSRHLCLSLFSKSRPRSLACRSRRTSIYTDQSHEFFIISAPFIFHTREN